MDRGACQCVCAGQGRLAVLHGDGLAAQFIFPVRHAGAAQGIGDQDQVISEDTVGQADHGRMDMESVRNQFYRRAAVKGRGDRAGRPVVQPVEGIINVGYMGSAGFKSGHGGIIIGDSMAHRYRTGLRDVPDAVDRAGCFGRHGDQAHHAAAGFIQAVEHGGIRHMDIIRILGPSFFVTDKRTFQMDSDCFCPLVRPLIGTDGFHGFGQLGFL